MDDVSSAETLWYPESPCMTHSLFGAIVLKL